MTDVQCPVCGYHDVEVLYEGTSAEVDFTEYECNVCGEHFEREWESDDDEAMMRVRKDEDGWTQRLG